MRITLADDAVPFREGVANLLKDRVGDIDELSNAIRQINAGRLVVDPTIVAMLVGRSRRRNPLDPSASEKWTSWP